MEQNLVEFLTKTLDDLKAQDILAIDVRGKSSITDAMIIATGTSVRHVASTAERLATEAKQAGFEVFRSGDCTYLASRCSPDVSIRKTLGVMNENSADCRWD